MSNLPGDITDDILLMFPAKSICRFRCICKPWCSLFNNDYFMGTRLKHSIRSEKLNFFSLKDYDNAHEFYMHITKFSSAFEDDQTKYVKMDSPFKDRSLKIEILGSSNGLILMKSNEYYLGRKHWLWNPSMKELKVIVSPRIKHGVNYGRVDYRKIQGSTAYEIGYNHDTDDYTISVATCYTDDYLIFYHVCEIQVYTSVSNSWKTLRDIFPYEIVSMNGKAEVIFVYGAFHWIAKRLQSKRFCIISFDIHGENFSEVAVTPQVDDILNNLDYNYNALGVLDGCLCIIQTYGGMYIDVWVMKDYNVIESWTKLLIARLPVDGRPIKYVKLLWEFKNGEVLFVTTEGSNQKNRLVLLV